MNRDEYVVELERSVEEKLELKVKEKRNSAERTRVSSRMRALDTYRVEAVNLDKLIVYLGPAIQETINSKRLLELPINVGSVENER